MRTPGADAWLRNRLVAGTALLFVGRLILSLARTGPVLVADEIGYLTNARVLAGGLPGQLERAPYYRGGYSVLISPLVALTSNPSLAYHLVLALNAALAASLFGLLYAVLTRCGGFSPRVALWAALAGAAYPSVTVFSQVALSENALFPLTCVWLLALGGVLSGPDGRRLVLWAAALGISGAGLWAVHGRMIVAVGLTVVAALWLVVRRRAYLEAVIVVVMLAAGVEATHQLNAFLVSHNYGGHATNEVGDRFGALLGLGSLLATLSNLVGQLWYLIVSTFGLVVVVFVSILPVRVHPAGPTAPPERRAFLVWLLTLTALLLLVSAASFPVRTRPDMLIYGRYVEVATPPLVALGVGLLCEGGWVRAFRYVPLTLAPLTLIAVLSRALLSDQSAANRWNVASLPFFTFQLGPVVLVGAAVVAIVGSLGLARLSRDGGARPGAIALALFLSVAAYGELNPVIDSQRAVYPTGWTSPEPVASARRIRLVAYDLAHYDEIGLYTLQWFLPHTRIELFDGAAQPSPSRYILTSARKPDNHARTSSVPLWRDVGRDQVLWRLGPRP